MKFDFSKVKSKELLKDGDYEGKILSWEQKQNKAKDGEVLWFKFEITNEEGNTQEIQDFFSLKEAAAWKLEGFFKSCGVEVKSGEGGEDNDIELDDLIGGSVILEITTDTYEGTKRNKVNGYKPVAF